MKVTKRQLKQIIKEELSRLTEVDGIVPTDKVSQGVAKKLGRKMKWRGGSEREGEEGEAVRDYNLRAERVSVGDRPQKASGKQF